MSQRAGASGICRISPVITAPCSANCLRTRCAGKRRRRRAHTACETSIELNFLSLLGSRRMQWIKALGITLGLMALVGGAHAFKQDSLVWKKCTQCHAPSADGKIPRVEEVRTTPEEWAVIVDRMRRLYGMGLKKEEMDGLLKELCATQILSPQEQAKVSYLSLWHNSQQVELPAGEDEKKLFVTCVRCHT